METLLCLLRDESPAAGAPEWVAALELAEAEHLLPWACSRMRSLALPEPVHTRVEATERAAVIAAFYFTSELKGLLRAFQDAALPVIPLKGPYLAERLYGAAMLRPNRDLDLLVRKTDLQNAEALLRTLGFTAVGWPDDYHQAWRRETIFVELHHDVENPLAFDFGVNSAWQRAQAGEFQGVTTWLLAPADEVLFLCLHAVRHRFDRLSLLLDLKLALEKLGQPPPGRLEDIVALCTSMLRRFDPSVKLPGLTSAHSERLADRIWAELLERPSEPMDWRALHAFYVELEPSASRRLRRRYRHARILAARLIGPDYAFAARFGLGRRWQVWLLRPLRLLLRVQ